VTLDKGDAQSKTESILRCIDYSHSNLSPGAQQLLLCLAPFTSVISRKWLPQYIDALRKQSALSHLSFERWEEVVEEAIHWGLLTPDQVSGYLRLQPVFPYFLKNRWQAPQYAALRPAVETAFREFYDELAAGFYQLLKSKEASEKQIGQLLTGLEYENLYTALHLALAAQVSIINLYRALSGYLEAAHEEQRGLKLGETVLTRLENYPTELLAGRIGGELVSVIDDIAKRQLLLKQYKLAETSYHKALAIWQANKAYEPDEIRRNSELPVLFKKAKDNGLIIIPIILRPCLFNETRFKFPHPFEGSAELSLSTLQSANPPNEPLNGLTECQQDQILLSVAQQLLKIVQEN
jgi:hypothetical protein